MRLYTLPTFNLTAFIWHNPLPADLAAWDESVPSRAPDTVTLCQLYVPRNRGLGELHTDGTSAEASALRTGFCELRCPLATDVRAPWSVMADIDFSLFDVAEVPANSSRLYLVTQVEQRHLGFPNEYRVAVLSQL